MIFLFVCNWCIDLVNCNVFFWQSNSARFCVNLKVIAISKICYELGKFSILHEARWIIPCRHLFFLLLLENVEEGAMRCLNCNHQTLFIRAILITVLPPKRQFLKIFVSNVCILCVAIIRADIFLLLLKQCD